MLCLRLWVFSVVAFSLLRMSRSETCIIFLHPFCMKYRLILICLLKLLHVMLHYSSLCMIISYVRHAALSFASCPCLRAHIFIILYACLSLCLCQKWVVSGLWQSLPSSYDFRVLSKRGNYGRPIFDRPQDLDVIVWTLDDHPCSCSIWVPEGLSCVPSLINALHCSRYLTHLTYTC